MEVDDVQPDRLHFTAFARAAFSCPELTNIPPEVAEEDAEAFRDSLSEFPIHAAFKWENSIREYPLPFFLVRVADIRAALGSTTTALELYNQAQALLGVGHDRVYDAWLEGYREEAEAHTAAEEKSDIEQEESHVEKELVLPYRTCKQIPRPAVMRMISLKETRAAVDPQWGPDGKTDHMWERYLHAYCIEMCTLDEVFQLLPQSARKMTRDGINPNFVEWTPVSKTKDQRHIAAMVREMKGAWKMAEEMASDYENKLTPAHIRAVHNQIMSSSRFIPVLANEQLQQTDPLKWRYVNVGRTRTETRRSLLVKILEGVQKTCPAKDVDSELTYMCGQAKQWIKSFGTANPISISAWLFMLINRVAPFEEGNHRMASLISAIPLIRQGIPPVIVPKIHRKEYSEVLAKAYEGNSTPLGDLILKSIKTSIEEVVNM